MADTQRGSIGLIGLTFLVLLAIKLLANPPVLTWFWVFVPLIVGAGIVALFLAIFAIIALGVWLRD